MIYFMHDLVPCDKSKITRTLLECKGIQCTLSGMARELANMNPIENVWNIMKKEIGNKIVCKKEDMWKRVYEAWYSVAPKVLTNFII